MINMKLEAAITCPFYVKQWNSRRDTSIYCEGVVSNVCRQIFDDRKSMDKYAWGHCVENHKNCEHYKLLMSTKYKEDS